ncbi:MAG TPA: hypothetical protein VKA84_07820, partial [Gemmatimonadaceae bacterium]|nr:hypothetical protein [Gemmatimonadaceae bacterium]
GTTVRGANAATTHVRVHYEHGTEYRSFVWAAFGKERRLARVTEPLPRPEPTTFFAQSPTEFVSFDILTGRTVHATFSSGTLTVSSRTGSVVAKQGRD